jgi:hypothetical protein
MNVAAEPMLTIQQFEQGQVDPERFDHEAHVHIGWLYLREFELPDALRRFDAALRRLTTQLGVPGKYHATITWLFLLLINERADRNEDWETFRSHNQDLIDDSRTMLHRYYSEDRLFSDDARQHFVLPDRIAG